MPNANDHHPSLSRRHKSKDRRVNLKSYGNECLICILLFIFYSTSHLAHFPPTRTAQSPPLVLLLPPLVPSLPSPRRKFRPALIRPGKGLEHPIENSVAAQLAESVANRKIDVALAHANARLV